MNDKGHLCCATLFQKSKILWSEFIFWPNVFEVYFIDPRITFEGKNINLLRGVLGKKYLLFWWFCVSPY